MSDDNEQKEGLFAKNYLVFGQRGDKDRIYLCGLSERNTMSI